MIGRWLPGAVLLGLAAVSTWLLFRLGGLGPGPETAERHDPDLFMEDFVTVRMGADGKPSRELRGARMEHYPDTDTHEVWQPHLLRHAPPGLPTELTSDHAWLSADGSVLLLNDKVYIWRDRDDGTRALEVITRDMRVLLDEEYAETDARALIRTPSGESRSVGLRADLARDRLELVADVESTYVPDANP